MKKLFCLLQACLPQILLSKLLGALAESKTPWIKTLFIRIFCRLYTIDWHEALRKNEKDYQSFNDFFTRTLEPHARSFSLAPNQILSPADGVLAHYGTIQENILIQAKNRFFSVPDLLAQPTQSQVGSHLFSNGSYATIYLAPHNYHRVHMPIRGRLIQVTHVPGKLFSVNHTTALHIPNLYARNERVICLFETDFGKVAVILVGAMIVGSIQLAWQTLSPHPQKTSSWFIPNLELQAGEELGHFRLGSTVILLLESSAPSFLKDLSIGQPLKMGQTLARSHAESSH